ncbi:MAG: cytochrome c biogenesis protein CcsA [Oligoflexus sp.]
MSTSNKTSTILGFAAFGLLALSWLWALKFAPSEMHMGEVYRIIYVHVPSAFSAFFAAAVLLGFSIWGLVSRNSPAMLWGRAAAEIGLIFTILCLATGAIWGRPTWGVWWVWDARLTTTLILAILYAGYLILYNSLAAGPQRNKICGVLGILIALDVPIIYKSVTWWRTLHQPPSLMRPGGSTMDSEMVWTLVSCVVVMLLVGAWLLVNRVKNLKTLEDLERWSFAQTP